MKITIESKLHGTSATMIAKPRAGHDGELIISERAWRRAVAQCCPGRRSGACRCPITVVEPYMVIDGDGTYRVLEPEIHYTVREPGCSYWSQAATLAQARRDLRGARNAGLSRTVIIRESDGAIVE